MKFDPFVIPFNIGLFFILIYVLIRGIAWFRALSRHDKLRLQRGFFGRAFRQSLKEIIMEGLLHRRIFRKSFRLGYMHMSLAFGWFLLILLGTIEADIFGERHLNAPYKAIFFKFFNPEHGRTGFEFFYSFLMDMILAFILSGLLLAVLKRFLPRAVGIKKTTKLRRTDKIALTSLWLIFPARLIAESLTSGAYGTGNFLTGTIGSWLASFLPAGELAYPFWWLYSLSLGTFFVLLPVTRYMHIPTEMFLIFLRNSGIATGDKAGSYSEVQTYSCSSCGICIDACQMNFSAGIRNMQGTYLLKGIRNREDVSEIAQNCLLCGRCDQACPVGIELSPVRMIARRQGFRSDGSGNIVNQYFPGPHASVISDQAEKTSFDFLPEVKADAADVLYFAGCMTHLTPSIKNSMTRIFKNAGVKWSFLDNEGGVCCGRPLMLSGQDHEARELINYNSTLIRNSGARILVTSCPICFKIFRESYYLDLEVLHHSQYIVRLIRNGLLKLNFKPLNIAYHTPCELGRGSGVFDEPKEIIKHTALLLNTKYDDENSLCCGGSLGNIRLAGSKRKKIARETAELLTKDNPEILATACPLCKKTLAAQTTVRVADIAEIVSEAISEEVSVRHGFKSRTRKEIARPVSF